MVSSLLYALRLQVEKDSTDARKKMFSLFIGRSRVLTTLYNLLSYKRLRFFRTISCALYGAATSAKPLRYEAGELLALYSQKNDRETLAALGKKLGEPLVLVSVNTDFLSGIRSAVYFLLRPAKLKRVLGILDKLNKKNDFFVCLRAAQTLFRYFYFKSAFARKRPKAIFISTEGNPHGIAVMSLRKVLGIPVVYAAHSAISTVPGRIQCDLGLFYGAAGLRSFLEKESFVADHVLLGHKDKFKKVKSLGGPGHRILVCLSKDPDEKHVWDFVRRIAEVFPKSEIAVRCHPHSLIPKLRAPSELSGRIVVTGEASLQNDLKNCFLAFAGNSNIHLDILLEGVPTYFIPSLDISRSKKLRFLERNLILPSVIQDCEESMTEHALKFYGNPNWVEEFSQYMNLAAGETESDSAIRGKLARFAPSPV